MVVSSQSNDLLGKQDFAISYVDRQEATFLLGILRNVNCSGCPDFYRGCKGGLTLHENATIDHETYLYKQQGGTEEHLCGKLRNILALGTAEEQELQNNFEGQFNRRVSLLSKKGSENVFVVIRDKDEFNNILKNMEREVFARFQGQIQDQINDVNVKNKMTIDSLQDEIRDLRDRLNGK